MIIEKAGKIIDGLYALSDIDLPAYLVAAKTPSLFDAGITFMGPGYLKEIRQYLGDENRLRWLFITHAHFDHSGTAPFLKRHIPGLKVAASRLASEIFKKPNAVNLIQSLSRDYEDQHKTRFGSENIAFDHLEVDRVLEDGETVDLGDGWTFKVIATPGHTRDGLSFYFPGAKALICGEAAGVPDRNFRIHPEFLASYRDYVTSLEKLAALDVEIIMLSHHYVLTGADARGYLKNSLERTFAFADRIRNYLDDSGGNQESVVKRIFKEDHQDTGAIQQAERPYLINLAAKVKAVAENK
ncbi:MAG TPA: MBL fold metallo-hydrolase [Syntrophales bacterium]|nr:MBL fold metallo-hydrolase [Syntrophales bacterium]